MREFRRKFVIELKTNDVYAIRNAEAKIKDWFDWGKFAECDVKLKDVSQDKLI